MNSSSSVLKAIAARYCRIESFCTSFISGDPHENTRGETKKLRRAKAIVG